MKVRGRCAKSFMSNHWKVWVCSAAFPFATALVVWKLESRWLSWVHVMISQQSLLHPVLYSRVFLDLASSSLPCSWKLDGWFLAWHFWVTCTGWKFYYQPSIAWNITISYAFFDQQWIIRHRQTFSNESSFTSFPKRLVFSNKTR